LWLRVSVQLGLAAVAGVLASIGALLLLSWAAGSTSAWARPSAVPAILWLAATATAIAWVWRLAGRALDWDRPAAAAEIEQRVGLARGAVRGAVEPGIERPGTSRSLVELHRARLAGVLEGRRISGRISELGSALARSARSYAMVSAALCITTLAASIGVWLGARESVNAAWAAVLHPVRHMTSPPLPALRLSAEARVRRGRDLPVTVEAAQRDSVMLAWQPRGEVVNRRWYVVREGRALASVPRLEAPTLVWAASADGAVSDTLLAEPVDPLLLIDVQVDLRFPPHTGREPELLSDPLPVMQVPEGTWATVNGVTTRPIERAALQDEGGRAIPFQVSELRRFAASFTVRSGAWGWEIAGTGSEMLEGDPDSLRFVTVPDSTPRVAIAYPGVDTTLGPSMTQPILVEAGDDYGLSRVQLVSWRVSAWGESWPASNDSLPLLDAGTRASLGGLIDARGRGFLPGDTLHYFVRAYDNAPDPQMGKSREFILRLPTLDEFRERAIADARDLVESAEQLAERARDHQESTETLERSTEVQPPPGGSRTPEGDTGGVEFRETEAARRALEEAGELLESSRQIQESLKELQEAIERAGLNDTSVLERLREIEALYERILTPELQEKLEALREALVELDPERIREAIRQLAEGSSDFRERVERSVELLRRAALEQQFQTLETQAEELTEAQEQLADAVAGLDSLAAEPQAADPTSRRLEGRATDLSQRAGELSQDIGELAAELDQAGEIEATDYAGQAESAAGETATSDQQVASALPGQTQSAARASQQAAAQMRQAASALREGRQLMQESWRQEAVEALRRSQAETLELARRQRELNESLDSADPTARGAAMSEQVALRRAVEQVEEQLADALQSSLLVDPALAQGAQQIGRAMEELVDQLADATRPSGADPKLAEAASEGLADLAYLLMQAGDAASAAQSGTGLQEALERLAQLAGQQGQLNAEAAGMTPGAGDALLDELRRLAGLQRAIAQQLGELNRSLGPRGQVLGQLEALEQEAEDLASEMERGRLNDEIVERQNRLFQRLLDAGRSMEQDEFERERRAERPRSLEILRPGELPPDLLRGPAYQHPGIEVLRRYPPAIRRLILEYFDRLNEREDSGGS
jgi:hypothetical protein